MTHEADTTQPYDYEKDLKTLSMMTNRLESYVRGTEIYGNEGMFISGFPAVTIGGILLRMRRLNALREFISKSDQEQLDASIAQHDTVYQEWTSHYETKVMEEANSRINRINQFIDEVNENPDASINSFEPEQMRRTILQEILYMLSRINAQSESIINDIKNADNRLRELLMTANFQWHPVLETVYSSDEFWWLYSEFDTEILQNKS